MHTTKQTQREARIRRIRAIVQGTAARPRLVIERTSNHFRAQLIDDLVGHTLAAASDSDLEKHLTGIVQAEAVGTLLAERAKKAGVTQVVLDRRGHRFHGRVAAFAAAVRSTGLEL